MKYIIGFAIVIFAICSLTFRYILFHPITVIKNGIIDIYDYIVHKKYNECKEYGKVLMFTASDSQAFGCGKSLSMVKLCNDIDKTYENKDVWDYDHKCYVKQHVFFVSNHPYISPLLHFISMFIKLFMYNHFAFKNKETK